MMCKNLLMQNANVQMRQGLLFIFM